MIGFSLTHYRITAKLGEGGMGEVYRATDTKLGREVAIKVLPKDFAADADRLRRFEQEAKTLAALNHPNVMTVFDAGQHDGAPYLVSELLEGRTLREELGTGALSVRKATDYALQVAQGLAAAHGNGVTHRDLKPENIFVTKVGRVKILDFGLAKLSEVPSSRLRVPGSADPDAPTVMESAADNTEPGRVMGTPAYMAPEQVRGEVVDHRADLFAFGCVLYEMVSGQRPFRRDTSIATMAAILNDEPPDLAAAKPDLPPALARIVHRCLEKLPERRFQTASDLAFALEATRDQSQPDRGGSQRDVSQAWPRRWLVAGLAVLVLGAVGLGWWSVRQSGQATKRVASPPAASAGQATNKSIAVLPFVNLSADKSDEYLSDGMTEELLNVLAQVPGLRVPGRSSSFAFKGRTEDSIFRKVGEQLRVATVLEGSVRKAGDKLRITAQLINVADGFHLWSQTYDRDMKDILAVQTEVAQQVVQALQVKLGVEATRALAKTPTEDFQAYRAYLQARYLWNRRSAVDLQKAIQLFGDAIRTDPTYGAAYSGLAECYVLLPEYAGVPPQTAMPKARAAALKAIELDPSLAEPHAALASVKSMFDWDWDGAIKEFQQAIRLNPNQATVHHWLSDTYLNLRRIDEALAEIKLAQQLDPLSPIINATLGSTLSLAGQHDSSISILRQQIALDPSFLVARFALGIVYFRQGRLQEGVAELETAHRQDPEGTYRLDALGFAYGRVGRTNDAQRLIETMAKQQQQGWDYRVSIALVEHALGNDATALDFLERAAEERASGLEWVNVDPFWKDLRPHPRTQAILRKMNLVK